jgi:hypothetical protein
MFSETNDSTYISTDSAAFSGRSLVPGLLGLVEERRFYYAK